MARAKNVIGLDIGSSAVKLCQVKRAKRGLILQAFGSVPLPSEAIVDGALMNSTAVVDAIQELWTANKIRQKEVGISVSGHSVIIKKISLPQMTPEELEESIQWEAEQYIPFDINDVYVDVQILGTQEAAGGQMDVLLVAAKKDMINDYTAVVAEAGLTPLIVDVDAFAIENMFEANYDVNPQENVCLINIGASVTNINVLAKGITSFTRDISVGGNQFTEEIQKQMNVSYDEAEAMKLGGGSGDQDAVVPQEVERIIHMQAESVASEIQRSLDFYAATSADGNISRIYVAGGSAKLPTLARVVENRTGIPVEVMNPFRRVDTDSKNFDPEYLRNVAPMAGVAVGLAMRRPGDKETKK